MYKVLTIAGSDPSGGAGIQGDLKTITALGAYGMSVITSLTAQNTCGVHGVWDVEPKCIDAQLSALFTDVFPDSIKIGMVSNAENIRVIASKLRQNPGPWVVLDPVMISTSGTRLLTPEAITSLSLDLFPLSHLITPNIPEAEALIGAPIRSKSDMLLAGQILQKRFETAVLIKGGHLEDAADDVLVAASYSHWFNATRIDNPNTHGTGCALSSAIACHLAAGNSLIIAVEKAKAYVASAISTSMKIGNGNGPLHHSFMLKLL